MLKTAQENIYVQYARQYGCSLAKAIEELREYPMLRDECINEFQEACGRAPTEDEIEEMRPDSIECRERFDAEEAGY